MPAELKMPPASVVVMTHNRADVLKKTIAAMLKQDYPAAYEIIVVNDGSTDGTEKMLRDNFGTEKRVRVLNQERSFPCRARNNGIKKVRYGFVAVMDDDCIPEKSWLRKLMNGFFDGGEAGKKGGRKSGGERAQLNPKIGVVSSFHEFGGTSTAFRRGALGKAGGYDEAYRYYREDTDLVFRVLDAGYENRVVQDAGFVHEHEMENPRSVAGWIRYGLERCGYHMNDVLLYKKNPARAGKFLDVRFGFIVNPFADWATATNQWGNRGELRLGSPRGITFMKNSTPLHTAAIVLGAWGYVLCVKAFRLGASVKFGKLLV